MKYSIIIPTYNHCDDLLIPCTDSILRYTNMSDVELIIVANGCTDNTANYLTELYHRFDSLGFGNHLKIRWSDQPMGYARSVNDGIAHSTGEKVILLNNDTVLLEQYRSEWIDLLERPFKKNPWCGISGPIKQMSVEANHPFVVFFCAMIARGVFDAIGLLNEDYLVGGGEDTEFCIEAERAGYTVEQCTTYMDILDETTYGGDFPIYHAGEKTVHDASLVKDWETTYFTNSMILARKYNLPYFKEQLMNNYERYLAVRGEEVAPREAARYKWAAKNLLGQTLLEVGCSNGFGSQFFPQSVQYLGIDIDEPIIQFAKLEEWGSTRQFQCSDVNDFELGFYDTIVAFEVIEHMDNGLEVVKRLKNHCNRLLVSVPYNEEPGFWGEHHRLHRLNESHFPDFRCVYMDRDGNVTDAPSDPLFNLMLCTYDRP